MLLRRLLAKQSQFTSPGCKRHYVTASRIFSQSSRPFATPSVVFGTAGAISLGAYYYYYIAHGSKDFPETVSEGDILQGVRPQPPMHLGGLDPEKLKAYFDSLGRLDTDTILNAYSMTFPKQGWMRRMDAIYIPSLTPAPDYLSTSHCTLPDRTWSFVALFDGHAGNATSRVLSYNLVNCVIGTLADLFSQGYAISDRSPPSADGERAGLNPSDGGSGPDAEESLDGAPPVLSQEPPPSSTSPTSPSLISQSKPEPASNLINHAANPVPLSNSTSPSQPLASPLLPLASELPSSLSTPTDLDGTAPSASSSPPKPDPASIDAALKTAFLTIDEDIVTLAATDALNPDISYPRAFDLTAPASSSSGALLAFFDTDTRILRVATTGTSKAVLGRRTTVRTDVDLDKGDVTASPDAGTSRKRGVSHREKVVYEAVVLSPDQTLDDTASDKMIDGKHKLEEEGGSSFGITGRDDRSGDRGDDGSQTGGAGELWPYPRARRPSKVTDRAFGAGVYKWMPDLRDRLDRRGLIAKRSHSRDLEKVRPRGGDEPVTAEPEVQSVCVGKDEGAFLILGSDGFWDSLTNEEAVGLVAIWLDENEGNLEEGPSGEGVRMRLRRIPGVNKMEPRKVYKPEDLPVVPGSKDKTIMYDNWKARKEFWNVDDNVAAHLARNALGGANEDLMAALLMIHPPRSNRVRDDLAVAVIFFD